MIRDGSLPGLEAPIQMPDGTYWDRWRKIRDILAPAGTVPDEDATLDDVGKRLVAVVDRELRRIEARQRRKGPLPAPELAVLSRLAETHGKLDRARRSAPPAKTPQQRATEGRDTGAMSEAATRRRLRELAQEALEKAAPAPTDAASPNGALNETADAARPNGDQEQRASDPAQNGRDESADIEREDA